jgi:hypothetical protein
LVGLVAEVMRKLLLLAVIVLTGCSEQAEGERCDLDSSGNDASGQGRDCESGLECVAARVLLGGCEDKTDRCCPPADQSFSEDRCRRRTSPCVATTGTGGTSAGGQSSGGQSGGAGAPATAGGAGGHSGGAGAPAAAGGASAAGGG